MESELPNNFFTPKASPLFILMRLALQFLCRSAIVFAISKYHSLLVTEKGRSTAQDASSASVRAACFLVSPEHASLLFRIWFRNILDNPTREMFKINFPSSNTSVTLWTPNNFDDLCWRDAAQDAACIGSHLGSQASHAI